MAERLDGVAHAGASVLYVIPDFARVLAHRTSSFNAVSCLLWNGGLLVHLLLACHGEHACHRRIDDRDDQRRQPHVVDDRGQQRDQADGQGRERPQPEQPGAAEHAGALAGLARLLGQLGLGQIDLLLDERGRLVGELLEQLTVGRSRSSLSGLAVMAASPGTRWRHGLLLAERGVPVSGAGWPAIPVSADTVRV